MRLPYLAILPAAFTAAGLAAGLAGALLVAQGEHLGLAAACLILGQLADIIDGWLARRLGVASDFGARLDFASDCAVTTALCWALGAWPLVAVVVLIQTVTRGHVSGRSGVVLAALVSIAVGGVR